MAMKKGRKEINESTAPESINRRLAQEKVKEYEKLIGKGAVKLIIPAEAQEIRKQKPDRMIGSKYVNTSNENECAEDGVKVKARWCILGHQDPDVLTLAAQRKGGEWNGRSKRQSFNLAKKAMRSKRDLRQEDQGDWHDALSD